MNVSSQVPEFEPPEIVASLDGAEDDEEWLFEPPPKKVRTFSFLKLKQRKL